MRTPKQWASRVRWRVRRARASSFANCLPTCPRGANTCARRAPNSRASRQWLATLTLAYPQVGFTLEHDGRAVFAFAPGDDLGLRLAHVFGHGAQAMVEVRAAGDSDGSQQAGVAGFISSPGDDRPDRRAQVLFVNGRLLRSTLVSGAWTAAYRTFAMVGRHPYGVLFFACRRTKSIPTCIRPRATSGCGMAIACWPWCAMRSGRRCGGVPSSGSNARSHCSPPPRTSAGDSGAVFTWSDTFVALPETSALRVLAQIDRTYILATDGTAIVLIDQHAAHERIVFEQLRANASARRVRRTTARAAHLRGLARTSERLDASLDALCAGGLTVEAFGERAYRIVATPARLVHAGKTRTFDVADFIAGLDDECRGLDAAQRIWASLACHSVVRAGERLELPEMTALVERLQRCENPMHCPHGRPTIVRLEPDAVARLFKRI